MFYSIIFWWWTHYRIRNDMWVTLWHTLISDHYILEWTPTIPDSFCGGTHPICIKHSIPPPGTNHLSTHYKGIQKWLSHSWCMEFTEGATWNRNVENVNECGESSQWYRSNRRWPLTGHIRRQSHCVPIGRDDNVHHLMGPFRQRWPTLMSLVICFLCDRQTAGVRIRYVPLSLSRKAGCALGTTERWASSLSWNTAKSNNWLKKYGN